MSKKIILITGTTQGIGKETAIGLAAKGHHIVLHGRNRAKLKDVCDEIKLVTGNNDIDTIVADLSLLEEARRMTNEFKNRYERLDVLINNAGVYPSRERQITAEGLERTMAVNLFAPLLIIQSLKPVLMKSDSARIINVSSAMHKYGGRPDFSDMQFERNYSPLRVYGLSKLYLIWVTRILSDMMKQRGVENVTVNSLHPGSIATNFGKDTYKSFLFKQIFKTAQSFMDQPAEGAKTSIFLATSPDAEGVTGKYFDKNGKVARVDDRYWSPENGKLVFDYCVKIIMN